MDSGYVNLYQNSLFSLNIKIGKEKRKIILFLNYINTHSQVIRITLNLCFYYQTQLRFVYVLTRILNTIFANNHFAVIKQKFSLKK